MNDRGPKDVIAMVLSAVAIVLAVIELFYRPFGVGPIGFALVLVALVMSRRSQRLTAIAAGAIGVGFLVGASIAIWHSNPLY